MTNSGFIARLAAFHPHLIATDIELAVETILEAVTQSLVAGGRVEVRGFERLNEYLLFLELSRILVAVT